MIITCLNIPSFRWNRKWCKILEFSLETQVLILFLLLFSPSFLISLLDNSIVRKSYQNLDYTNVVSAALMPFLNLNFNELRRFNSTKSKKHIYSHRKRKNKEKMYRAHAKIWKFLVNPIWSGLFWSTIAWGGTNYLSYLKFDLLELGSRNKVCI